MRDFTLDIYKELLQKFLKRGYRFITVEEYFTQPIERGKKYILMRHDVDRKPQNSLAMAEIENSFGVKATYYFRTIPQTLKPYIIQKIALLDHEIAYHYESLAQQNGDYEKAIEDFKRNLETLRKIYPIKNIAMHGRPTSQWDSRLLWEKFDYREFGILSEPYFDIDFHKVLYLTDASRSWNNSAFNVRDKVESSFQFYFTHTQDIIKALDDGKFPQAIMFNIHPEHWARSSREWYKTLFIRGVKNSLKRVLYHR